MIYLCNSYQMPQKCCVTNNHKNSSRCNSQHLFDSWVCSPAGGRLISSGLGWFGQGFVTSLWSAGVTCSGVNSACGDCFWGPPSSFKSQKTSSGVSSQGSGRNIRKQALFLCLRHESANIFLDKKFPWPNPGSRPGEVCSTRRKQASQSPMVKGLGRRDTGTRD